jgi:hypothetical protein
MFTLFLMQSVPFQGRRHLLGRTKLPIYTKMRMVDCVLASNQGWFIEQFTIVLSLIYVCACWNVTLLKVSHV